MPQLALMPATPDNAARQNSLNNALLISTLHSAGSPVPRHSFFLTEFHNPYNKHVRTIRCLECSSLPRIDQLFWCAATRTHWSATSRRSIEATASIEAIPEQDRIPRHARKSSSAREWREGGTDAGIPRKETAVSTVGMRRNAAVRSDFHDTKRFDSCWDLDQALEQFLQLGFRPAIRYRSRAFPRPRVASNPTHSINRRAASPWPGPRLRL